MAAHHATLLFQPWIAFAVFLHAFLQNKESRINIFMRFALFAVITTLAALIVIWPFWQWGSQQEIQKTIDHLSRHNFIKTPLAAGMFFLPMYGLLMFFIPFGLWMGMRKRFWGFGIAFLFLFLLGLGDTTPLPRIFFGAGWAWLTYDRFAFWATLTLLPFFGMAVALLMRKKHARRGWLVFIGLMGVISLVIGDIPAWLPTQPKPIDMRLIHFLAEPTIHHSGMSLWFRRSTGASFSSNNCHND
jgi:MFS family permease